MNRPQKLHIVCTQEDCDDAIRGSDCFCVVSTAIARLIPEANRIQTDRYTIRFSLKDRDGKNWRYVYQTPPMVRDYVIDYDAGTPPHPMEFDIEHPEITELIPAPAGKAKTPSFKAQAPPKTRRSVRVFGEKRWVASS